MTDHPTLAVVYLRWADDPDDVRLRLFFAALTSKGIAPIASCVVNNRPLAAISGDPALCITTIAGDNSAREFSGYNAGLQHLRETGVEPDVWLLVNDRFDLASVQTLDPGVLHSSCLAGAAVGQVDRSLEKRMSVLGHDVSTWIRSNLLVIPDSVVKRIPSLVPIGGADFDLLVKSSETVASDEASLGLGALHSPRWEEFVSEWLTGTGGRGLQSHWYLAAPVGPSNRSSMLGKVHSILNEQLLSASVREVGAALLPLELASRLGRLPGVAVRRGAHAFVRRWPTLSVAVLSRRGVPRAVGLAAHLEARVRSRSSGRV